MVYSTGHGPQRRLHVLLAGCALLAGLALSACYAPSNGVGGTGEVDNSFSDLAIGNIAGAASTGDVNTGVAYAMPHGRLNWTERLAGLFALEQVANAASYSCFTAASWGAVVGSAIQFNPTNVCTLSYANGTKGTYSVTGSWTFTFGGPGAAAQGGAVSNNPTGTTVARAATSPLDTVTKTYTGPLGNTYSVTEDTTHCAPWTGSVLCGGDLVTCLAPGCPHIGAPTGVRSIVLQGMQVTGTKDGNPYYDHTIASTAPIVITGFGKNRVISSGTVVVYHNMAMITTTTIVISQLTHEANCAYPVSGSVSTVISGGVYNGLTETVTFTGVCGVATVQHPDGSTSDLQLHLVL